jgi:hypothetical protein
MRTATLRKSGDISSAAARISRAACAESRPASHPPRDVLLLFLVAEPGGFGDHLRGRHGRVGQAGEPVR